MGRLRRGEPRPSGCAVRAGLARAVERLVRPRSAGTNHRALRFRAPDPAAAGRRGHPRLRPAELRRGPRPGRSPATPAPAAAAVSLRPSQDAARHRRDPRAGRHAVRAAGLARPAREGHVHGHPDHGRHRLRQDVGRAVPVHGAAHPPARPRPGPEDGRAHHRRQGQLRRLRSRPVRARGPPAPTTTRSASPAASAGTSSAAPTSTPPRSAATSPT